MLNQEVVQGAWDHRSGSIVDRLRCESISNWNISTIGETMKHQLRTALLSTAAFALFLLALHLLGI
jgi:hypothetical protein